jgi:AAA+ ATPase superfamily predicted ATPase
LARGRKATQLIVVVDELPYLAQADAAVPSVLQRWWDGLRRDGLTNVKVFLLGSHVSWMEEHTLSERGPLHNRRTGQIKVEPLGYAEAALFYPSYTPFDRVAAYAIWGGLPSYLAEIDQLLGPWENVRQYILPPATRLADEPSWLRFTDLRNDVIHSSILRAIALGHRRPGKIAAAVGKSRADEVIHHLERLCDLRLVERLVPIHEERERRSRHAVYVLADHYVAFWYRYVDRLRHLLGLRRYDEALRRIRDDFDKYISERAFEDICRQFTHHWLSDGDRAPGLSFDTVGAWWASADEESDEIDVVAMQEGRTVMVGECKWSRQAVGLRDLDGLRAGLYKATQALRPVDRPWRVLFSRGGFDAELTALAENPEERLLLIGPDDLYAGRPYG